jgi:hypothetical protein
VLYSLSWRQGSEDCIWWIPSKRKNFEVRSFFMNYLLQGILLFLGGVFGKLKPLMREFFCVDNSSWEDFDFG